MTMLTGSFLLQDLTKMPPSLLISSKKISVIGRHLSVSVENGPVSDKVVPRTIGSVQEPILATAGVAKAARQPTRQAAANFIDFLPSLLSRRSFGARGEFFRDQDGFAIPDDLTAYQSVSLCEAAHSRIRGLSAHCVTAVAGVPSSCATGIFGSSGKRSLRMYSC